MANTFNLDNVQRLKSAMQSVEAIPSEAKKGIDASVDMATDSGSSKLIASANNMSEAYDALAVTVAEFTECGNKLQKYYDEISQAV